MQKLFILLVFITTALVAGEMTSDTNVLNLVFGSFISGILLTFTPCVLPMIPILSSIIVGQGENLSKTKSVSLSLFYVLGTATTYALMGALAGATGEQLQAYFQNVWAIGIIVFIFVIMALSMFGLFNIQLPSGVQSKLTQGSTNLKGGSFSVFFLGMISALIIGACVSPILISFLGIAISNGDPLLGGLTMFSMAIGMGVPLIVLGFGAGSILPKAGMWMNNIKNIFGVLLLATAIFIFNTLNIIEPLFMWGSFFIILSVYLKAFRSLSCDAGGLTQLFKGFGLILALWGAVLIFGGLNGEKNIFKPLENLLVKQNIVIKQNNIFSTVKYLSELDMIKERAIKENKPLFIYFYKDSCVLCQKLNNITLADATVINMLEKNFISVKVNISDVRNKGTQEIRKKYKVFGAPSFVFYDRYGDKDENAIYGYQEPEEFYDTLDLLID